ncbi:ATP-binding cassette domain-containing protein [Pullulanibacillus sp. KACC 23026]|uniref:ATP-binding cassette domain-containing protein n=1 Tax=Pullulanibacillus sp. KACC 23026 TaxID=3028315 RepID=UPI0023B17578|nr:ATP-binding cassette domain-containing protein [Pullulanibacillus sp. KACC 23026]WEG10856.1 ATP-binding cassette domain-containing protein [Pullulanibacillus sp. KACC 23026]
MISDRELIAEIKTGSKSAMDVLVRRYYKQVFAYIYRRVLDKSITKERVTELLELVHLAPVKRKKIKTYSGGMKRRLGIAQALLNNPKVLIVDEPTAGLDPKERIHFRNLLSELSSQRIVLLSTHIVSDIEFIAKEILILKEGRLIHKKDPQTLLNLLKGKVWTLSVPADEVADYQKTYKIGNMVRQEQSVELRLISDSRVHEDALISVPNLEDLYLYFFDKEDEYEGAI